MVSKPGLAGTFTELARQVKNRNRKMHRNIKKKKKVGRHIATVEDSLEVSQNIKHSVTKSPAILLLGIYSEELETGTQTNVSTTLEGSQQH